MCSVKAKLLEARRAGFTLIELLIVIVIIGILAAIAIPKFGKTRERAYFKAMMSDLRNLHSQQEVYYANQINNYSYAGATTDIATYNVSQGVTVTISEAGTTGWGATATHVALASDQICAIYAGTVATVPDPALTPGVVTCTNE